MNDFNKLMRYASLKAQKAEIEREMKEIENHFKATTGTKENPQCVGCFRVWVTESETTSYNKTRRLCWKSAQKQLNTVSV